MPTHTPKTVLVLLFAAVFVSNDNELFSLDLIVFSNSVGK